MANGFLKAPAFLTRTGVFLYRKKDGTVIRELRHPEDVFNMDSLKSLQMVPLTNDHPTEFVTPENAKNLSVGWIGDTVQPKGSFIGATVVVADKESIANVETGKVELSCGYTADLLDEKGSYEGQPYDVRQTNIRYNHVALVDRGRAGPQVKLRLDAEDAYEVQTEEPQEKPKMKIKIGDKEFEASQELADAFNAFQKQMDAVMAKGKCDADELGTVKAKLDLATANEAVLKKDSETLKAKLDIAEDGLKKAPTAMKQDEIDKMVSSRTAILDAAKSVLPKDFKFADHDNASLKREVVKVSKKMDVSEKSDTYIEVMFDSIVSESAQKNDRAQKLGAVITDIRKDEDFDSSAARQKMIKDREDGWKQPLAVSKK